MPDADWWQALWPDPDGIVRSLGIEPGMMVVDVGCGSGYFTAAVARRAAPGRAIGVDIDPAMLAQARVSCRGLANCAWLSADAMQLSHALAAPADYVLIANTFHGAPHKTALSREVAAVLKRAGRFAIVNWHAQPRAETRVLDQPRGPPTELRLSPEATRAAVEPAGFALELLLELPPYHYAAIFRRAA